MSAAMSALTCVATADREAGGLPEVQSLNFPTFLLHVDDEKPVFSTVSNTRTILNMVL